MATNIPTKAKNHIHQPYKVKQNEMSSKKKRTLGMYKTHRTKRSLLIIMYTSECSRKCTEKHINIYTGRHITCSSSALRFVHKDFFSVYFVL